MDHSQSWSRLREGADFDLVVIGAGINGVGVAYDAAINGLRTLVIEKDDVASGTTACSSRLIHGGLRYLDRLEIGLVRESLRERSHLLQMAPHLVEPLELVIPVYDTNRHRLWKVRLGLWLYDWLSRDGGLPRRRRYTRKGFRASFPSVRHEGLEGAAGYHDARVEFAERLCLEVAIAARRAGAMVLTHSEVVGLEVRGQRIERVTIRNRLDSELVALDIGPDTDVLNTSGPWVDEVLGRITSPASGAKSQAPIKNRIGGVRGSHILVDRFEGAPRSGLYVEASSDGRPYFILPWRDRLLIGTTERLHETELDRAAADDDEIDYLLAETNRVVPSASLSRDDVLLCYAGVRALPAVDRQRLGRITRRHLLVDHRGEGISNLWSLVGGKLTTFRGVAEEVVDSVLARRSLKRENTTSDVGLPGAWPSEQARKEIEQACVSLLGEAPARHLLALYGAEARGLLAMVSAEPSLGQPIAPGIEDRLVQIVWGQQREAALCLTDLVCRRWLLPMRHPELLAGLESVELTPLAIRQRAPLLAEVAYQVSRIYGWSGRRSDDELVNFVVYVRERLLPSYRLRDPESR